MKNIAIFASGSGSNALKILEHFEGRSDVKVGLIVTNRKHAGVLDHASAYNVPTIRIDRSYFYDNDSILDVLDMESIDLIVLAGFLWLIPDYLVAAYPDKIVNIHPALLPKYGGKGMYGHHVHTAVKANNETLSGMTIHFVNEKYDDGGHIFQAQCAIDPNDTVEVIGCKVLELEHEHYASVIDRLLTNRGAV